MPTFFSELKSGGTIPMLSPHSEKWGDASPRPPPIDAREYDESRQNAPLFRQDHVIDHSTRCSVCAVATRPTSYLRSRINSHGLLHLRALEIVQNNFIKANTTILTTLGGELCRQVRSKSVIF